MKKYKLNIALLISLVIAGGMAGCRKEANLYPSSQTSVDSENAFASAPRIEALVNGFYRSLKHGQFYGGRYLVYNDVRAENFLNKTQNGVTAYLTWGHNLTNGSNEVQDLWRRAYIAINNANLFIDGMEAGGTAVVGEQKAKEYLGEARFIRALSYYSLLQMYAQPFHVGNGSSPGLPMRLTGNIGADDYDLARSSVAEVYTQIIEDLNFAELNLPLSNADALANTTRAHKNTAIALKTRVFLSKGDYGAVVTEGNKIVSPTAPFTTLDGVSLGLVADFASIFEAPYLTNESIFSLPMDANSAPGTQNALQYYYLGNEEYTLNPDGIYGSPDWNGNDERRALTEPVGGRGAPILTKFTVGSPWTDFVPVMRYSEVLLNLGEAIARNTKTVDARAVALLNAVRHRSDPTVTFTTASFANADALYAAFLTERNIEFLGEGMRSIDLLRLGLPFPAIGGINAVSPADNQYIWPMSALEILYNPSIGK